MFQNISFAAQGDIEALREASAQYRQVLEDAVAGRPEVVRAEDER